MLFVFVGSFSDFPGTGGPKFFCLFYFPQLLWYTSPSMIFIQIGMIGQTFDKFILSYTLFSPHMTQKLIKYFVFSCLKWTCHMKCSSNPLTCSLKSFNNIDKSIYLSTYKFHYSFKNNGIISLVVHSLAYHGNAVSLPSFHYHFKHEMCNLRTIK